MGQPERNREIVVKTLPKGALTPDHFEMREAPIPEPGEGEAVIRTILMSIDAANRAWMQGPTYRKPVLAGDVMHTYALGEVVASADARLAVGDLVASESFWADYAVIRAKHAEKIAPEGPLSRLMSVYGIAGKTAWHGLMGVGGPKAGDTVLVSAAAGSVGAYVGQIAKAKGCRAVGIAGGPQKCAWATETLGFDACVDHRDPGFFKTLRTSCPNGVDVYFDNVGGRVLESALFCMNERS
ncbi:MAG: NADP-dependent oxidoreductase, partial [Pseudomonadota bacterium]